MVPSIVADLLSSYLYIIGTLVFAIIYFTYLRHYSYFNKQNVKFVRCWPLVGSMLDMMIGRESLTGMLEKFYNAYPNERFIGFYELMGTPVYMIRDSELIKQIAIKDFDHFVNHRMSIGETNDPLFSRSLFVMRNERWRGMRSTLSPAFTGSKMRLMMSLISECARKFSNQILLQNAGESKVYDLRDLFSRFASDAIATSAFGLEVNSLKDRDNEFYRTGVAVTNFTGLQGLKFLGYTSVPGLMDFFKVKFFTDNQIKFFRDLVHGNMSYREKNNVVRHDMINLLMEAKKGNLQHNSQEDASVKDIGYATVQESEIGQAKNVTDWHDDDFVAQCMIFFLAGFNAVTGGVGFLVHELACNADIQKRLYAEVAEVLGELKGDSLTYDAMQQMKYLDMVVSETLRRWSLSAANDRYVNKPYVLENSDGTKVQLNVGDGLWMPTYAMQMDPQYFPNPERFDPERFSDANKGDIPSGVYAPFGTGPRNCIGSRFALMEMKALVVYLLSNFEILKCAKTPDPLVLKKGTGISVEPENGFWAELKPRDK